MLLNQYAMANAEAAAITPIPVVFKAPANAFSPVSVLLKYPKIMRQIMVMVEDNFNPLVELLVNI